MIMNDIAIIGGADGPTAVYIANKLTPFALITISIVSILALIGLVLLVYKLIKKINTRKKK